MDEIINAILCSPSLDLPDTLLDELSRLIGFMKSVSLTDFSKTRKLYFAKYKSSPLNTAEHIKKIKHFISAWEDIMKLMHNLTERMTQTYNRLDVSILGADDCMPLYVLLLNTSETNLMLLLEKLSQAGRLFTCNLISYTIMTLRICATYKLSSSQLKRSASSQALPASRECRLVKTHSANNMTLFMPAQKNLQRTSIESDQCTKRALIAQQDLKDFTLVEKYIKLKKSCPAYLDSLKDEIIEKFKTEDPDIYYEFTTNKHENLIEDIVNKFRADERMSAAFNLLIEKYIRIQEFSMTLKLSDRPLFDVMTLFSQIYEHHFGVLTQIPNKFSVSARSLHSYYLLPKYLCDYTVGLLPINTYESAFHANANDCCNYLKNGRAGCYSVASSATPKLKT